MDSSSFFISEDMRRGRKLYIWPLIEPSISYKSDNCCAVKRLLTGFNTLYMEHLFSIREPNNDDMSKQCFYDTYVCSRKKNVEAVWLNKIFELHVMSSAHWNCGNRNYPIMLLNFYKI